MAIQKMSLMNIVVPKDHADEVMKDLIVSGIAEFVDANQLIDETNFVVSSRQEHADEILEMNAILPYQRANDVKGLREKLSYILDVTAYTPTFYEDYLEDPYKFHEVEKQVGRIYDHLYELMNEKEEITRQLQAIDQAQFVEDMKGIEVDFRNLYALEYFQVKLGYLRREDKLKLAKNYENLSVIFLGFDQSAAKELMVISYPKDLEVETERILRSVHFEEVSIPEAYLDVPANMLKKMQQDKSKLTSRLNDITEISASYIEQYYTEIDKAYIKMLLEEKASKVSEFVASTAHFVYFSVWLPSKEKEAMREKLEGHTECVITSYEAHNNSRLLSKAPTYMKNKKIFAPFEQLVTMYGVPAYDELDPTAFFGISYMLLFGAMFGDLGQGLLLALVGWLMTRKKKVAGQLLIRIGFASSFFGFFYDSFFGYEHVISRFIPGSFYLRPIENINTILFTAVGIGIGLLLISFSFSLINKLSKYDLEEGLFGRNGLAGLVLFVTALLLVLGTFTGRDYIQQATAITLISVSILVMIVKEPLSNLIKGKRPLYQHGASEYYVESGFNIVETLLGMLSNSVSFIRVGAFALNHVGLFIAFHTLAEGIGGLGGEISMFILGNLLVLGLEGLIVFIQGLRLIYYELFSKYYEGTGRVFEPVVIKNWEVS